MEGGRPAVLPRSGGGDRRRALLLGTAALLLGGAVDTVVAGAGPRTALWGAWIALFLLCAAVLGRHSAAVDLIAGTVAGVGSVALLAALAWLSGAGGSPYFSFLVVIPLLSAIAAPGEVRETSVLGAAVVLAGGAMLLHQGISLTDLVVWGAMNSACILFAVAAGELQRRRQTRFLQVERERADALARLAELERARAETERWVAVGQVADRVAHAANSPLGAMKSSIAFARGEIAAGRPEVAAEALQDAAECVERIRAIVAELQARDIPLGPPRRG